MAAGAKFSFPGYEAACCRYADGMCGRAVAVVLSLATFGCEDSSPTTASGSTMATVRLVFMGATARRTNLPASAQACVNGVGATHTHPSWHSFAAIPLLAMPPDRYEITFTDVPVNTRVSLRVNDQNACDENPTGAVIRNVFVNGIGSFRTRPLRATGTNPALRLRLRRTGLLVSSPNRRPSALERFRLDEQRCAV